MAARLPSFGQRGQQQRRQNGYDSYNDQQFDQCETLARVLCLQFDDCLGFLYMADSDSTEQMRLKAFRIQNYKIIDDTGWVPVDERVTGLVGKNEAGKTAILRALWKSKNVVGRKFDKLLDYPRDRYAKERKGIQEAVALEFEPTDEEARELASQFLVQPHRSVKRVVVSIFYKGEDETETRVGFDDKIEKSLVRLSSEAQAAIEGVADVLARSTETGDTALYNAKKAALAGIDPKAYLWAPKTASGLNSFQSGVTQWISQNPNRQSLAQQERQNLSDVANASQQGDPSAEARQWVLDNIPAFIYFDDYGQLETRIYLPAYLQRRSSPDEKIRTQTALFERSNLDPQEILQLGRPREGGENDEQVQRRKDKRRALLDSASFGLTGEWIDWWTEKRHRLHFDADGDDLVLKVSDEHNEFPIPFEERSHGFQWFFSFYLVFLAESARAHKGAILLLDEPGLHLHPTLQAKLVELFNRISETNQLIYSTHLPFLVDGNHLDRVRTVHLAGTDPQKSVVSNDVRPTGDRDTLFPLQAAIGYSIAQTLFLGKRSVIVEGITDYWLLKALNDTLAALKVTPLLHPDTILIPAGGISRLMPLASIMFSTTGVDDRQMLVLLDSDKEGTVAAGRHREVFGDDSSVLMLGNAIGLPKATIEDLVPRKDYSDAVRQSGSSFTLNADETQESMNVVAMQKVFARHNWGAFDQSEKAGAALKLIDAWGKNPESVPSQTRTKATTLFAAINQKFAPPSP